jgi:hypothetical protein
VLGASNLAFIQNRSRFLASVARELIHPPDFSRQSATLDATRRSQPGTLDRTVAARPRSSG